MNNQPNSFKSSEFSKCVQTFSKSYSFWSFNTAQHEDFRLSKLGKLRYYRKIGFSENTFVNSLDSFQALRIFQTSLFGVFRNVKQVSIFKDILDLLKTTVWEEIQYGHPSIPIISVYARSTCFHKESLPVFACGRLFRLLLLFPGLFGAFGRET